MKKLLLLTLFGCIALCNHAGLRIPYDRSINPRSSEFTPCTIVPADSTLITVIDGIEMSAMDYAEIYIMRGPIDDIYKDADYNIVGFGPSPRLRALDKSSTERKKLIIADNPFYIANFEKREVGNIPPFGYLSTDMRILESSESAKIHYYHDCLADNLTFDFDLSEYSCDFDIYILLLNTKIIFDRAFSNFKFSDNIKSINVYLNAREIGHEAFTSLSNIENVDVRLMSAWSKESYYDHHYIVYDFAYKTIVYYDSFSQDTYETALLKTNTSESEINELLTNRSAENYSNNIYRYFYKWHSGVEDISTDECLAEYKIQGRTIRFTNLSPQQTVNVFTISGACVGSYTADGYGMLEIDVDQSGFYLIRVDNICYKVTIN